MYVREIYAFNVREDTTGETLWIKLLLPKTKPIFVGTCYRPHNQSNFNDHLEESLSQLKSDCETIVLVDFNTICFNKKNSSLYSAYLYV